MKSRFTRFFSLLLLVGLLLSACIPAGPGVEITPEPTREPLPETGGTETPASANGAIRGQVWHDVCAIAGGEGGEPAVPSAGCVEIAEGGFQANGILEEDEPGIQGVVVDLGQGACPASGLAQATTDADGRFAFEDLAAGEYCVSIDPLVEPNQALLVPGGWTAPSEAGQASVTLGAGEAREGVNFGWDYQFLPAPTPEGPEAFKAWVIENFSSRNWDELRRLMGDPFWLAGWRSEAQALAPDEAIEQVKAYRGEGNVEFVDTGDPASFFAGEDPRTYLSPEVQNPELLLVRGLGETGADAAALILAQHPDGSYYWYGMLTVFGGFQEGLPPVSEAEPFKAYLRENIASRNYEELRKTMGDQFFFGMWQSEAGFETPENAIRLLRDFFGENEVEFVEGEDAAALLGFDPLSIINPEVTGADVLLVRNVGTGGNSGAILYIAQKPDSSYYWYGLLVVRQGF